MKRLNSSESISTSSPKTQALRESASILNGIEWSNIFGWDFNAFPVLADPVNVTTSRWSKWSNNPLPSPGINCKLPSGKILELTISLTIKAVK